MNQTKKLVLLRIAYWWGAITDGLLAVEMYCSAFMGATSPFTGLGLTIPGGIEYRYAMCIAATFMLGWTILLIWADRKPFERKGILLLTVFPIVVGIQISGILEFQLGLITFEALLSYTIQRILLGIFYIFCYRIALKQE